LALVLHRVADHMARNGFRGALMIDEIQKPAGLSSADVLRSDLRTIIESHSFNLGQQCCRRIRAEAMDILSGQQRLLLAERVAIMRWAAEEVRLRAMDIDHANLRIDAVADLVIDWMAANGIDTLRDILARPLVGAIIAELRKAPNGSMTFSQLAIALEESGECIVRTTQIMELMNIVRRNNHRSARIFLTKKGLGSITAT
jgi:hypothetical protein